MLFGGSCRFTSSAASSTRSRPTHAIGVVSLVHTRVVAAGPDPEPHSGRCSMPSSAKTLAFVTSFPGDESSFSRTMGSRWSFATMPRARASTASHSAGECQELEPNRESSAARTASPAPEELG